MADDKTDAAKAGENGRTLQGRTCSGMAREEVAAQRQRNDREHDRCGQRIGDGRPGEIEAREKTRAQHQEGRPRRGQHRAPAHRPELETLVNEGDDRRGHGERRAEPEIIEHEERRQSGAECETDGIGRRRARMGIEPALCRLAPVEPEPAGTGDQKREEPPGEARLQPAAPEGDGERRHRGERGRDSERGPHFLAGLGHGGEDAKAEGAGNRPGPERRQAGWPERESCQHSDRRDQREQTEPVPAPGRKDPGAAKDRHGADGDLAGRPVERADENERPGKDPEQVRHQHTLATMGQQPAQRGKLARQKNRRAGEVGGERERGGGHDERIGRHQPGLG